MTRNHEHHQHQDHKQHGKLRGFLHNLTHRSHDEALEESAAMESQAYHDPQEHELSPYDPNYPYYKSTVTTDMSEEGYPIIERTTNGLLYPEGPHDEIDMKQIKE